MNSNPISFSKTGNVATFRYASDFLKEWISLGNRDGNTGPILVSIDYDSKMQMFATYGTIENPCRTRYKLNMKHWDVMDGPLKPPESYVNPVEERPFKDFGWFIPGDEKGIFNKIDVKWK